MESRKPTTRTVAQRKVYGKRRTNAPRAIFEHKSPAKTISPLKELNDSIETIETKLAEVSIGEEPPLLRQELDFQDQQVISNQHETSSDATPVKCPASPASPDTPQSSFDSPSKQPRPDTRPIKPTPYETMVEVRISTKTERRKASRPSQSEEVSATKKKLPTARRSSGFVHDDKANTYVRSILHEALSPISSQSIQRFSTWASRSATMFHVAKLAEGSYGEVYKLHLREEASRPMVSKSKLAKLRAYGDGGFQGGAFASKDIEEIVAEVKMLKYLDPIPGFARFREIHVVQGRFPESFQGAWDHYKKTKDDCLNPNPANKKAYPDSQLWAIIEMDDAGCELEKFCWSSIFQIYDIFWGVAMALARAEEYALFEHRDLHLGNICIRSVRPDGSMEPPTELDIARQTSPSGFGLSSLETTIIDYSLSRANLHLADLPDGSEEICEIASSDLDKKHIFDSIGQDEDEALLRDTYRYMRATLYTGIPLETEKTPDIPGIWTEYAPRTNLVWLLFLLKNLLKNRKPEIPRPVTLSQRTPLAPCSPNRKATSMQRSTNGKLVKAKELDMGGTLVKEYQNKNLQTRVEKLKQTLEDRLKVVLGLLDLEHGHEDMCCAADLVAYAMDSQWLAEQDFF
ncbi:hypothetical protein N7462_002633 [Penicillium macrosclerotiorum]|uniref:uncharacterized protein n=1 Tax=Penicillium macrosclerotiorum TaxID=303699 RepID=UPI002547B7A1|nr:uncharacterized protein N7462_002633 [Penicillium macrosclerotiorum]KAJ5693210.1 hypothetical protein N7462_002633 [Penicillium macrosclerotiorum]